MGVTSGREQIVLASVYVQRLFSGPDVFNVQVGVCLRSVGSRLATISLSAGGGFLTGLITAAEPHCFCRRQLIGQLAVFPAN